NWPSPNDVKSTVTRCAATPALNDGRAAGPVADRSAQAESRAAADARRVAVGSQRITPPLEVDRIKQRAAVRRDGRRRRTACRESACMTGPLGPAPQPSARVDATHPRAR